MALDEYTPLAYKRRMAKARITVFLITVFAKKEKDNLTKAERSMLAKVVRILRDSYGE